MNLNAAHRWKKYIQHDFQQFISKPPDITMKDRFWQVEMSPQVPYQTKQNNNNKKGTQRKKNQKQIQNKTKFKKKIEK